MDWHKIALTNDQVAQGLILEIQFASAGVYRGQKDVALLIDDTPNEVVLYFTPSASDLCADLIRQHNGQPCSEPSLKATLLWGDDSYFPDARAARSEG